ncbi:MAG: sugar ABC transporter permease [Firmicutes bacterium]|nr:sugar ABC transporter permease [Bacillota bacterium]
MSNMIATFFKKHFKRDYVGLLFVLPGLIFFCVFRFWPMIQALYVSLHEWNLLTAPKFIGLQNYAQLFSNTDLKESLIATFKYVIGSTIPLWVLALAVAILFNREIVFRQGLLAAYFLPLIMSVAIVAVIFKLLYHPQGLLNVFLWYRFGFTLNWLTDKTIAPLALIIMALWKNLGYYTLLYLAGLEGIPIELIEAAKIDGASPWRTFVSITLPLLRPTVVLVMVMSLISSFQAFTEQYIMTEGGPGNATRVLTLLIYQNAFQYLRMGWASTMAILLFVIILLLTVIQMRLLKTDIY